MTRFLYLCDTHYGTDSPGYRQQMAYPQRQAELLQALTVWIAEHAPLEFIVHGGDLIDASSIEAIREVARLYALDVPVYLCLGNHDLTDPEAHRWWLQHAPSYFPGGDVNFDVVCDDCVVHVAPNQWSRQPYCWQGEQRAHFLAEQRQHLEQALARHPDRPHILVTHAPARGVPAEQTGGNAPSHATGPEFEDEIGGLLAHCRDPRLVLTGHSHMNMHVQEGATHYVGASSFVEAPFEFKLVEVSGADVSVSTHSLGDRVSFAWQYDADGAYVQGRPCDRGFKGIPAICWG